MNKKFDKIKILQIILLISFLFNSFVFKITNTYEITGILFIFLILFILLFGFEKNNYRNKKDALLTILISLLIYYFLTYFLGIFFGFYKTAYSLTFVNIIKNIFPIVLVIVFSELLRYAIITKQKKDIIGIVLSLLIFILVDINTNIHLYDIKTNLGIVKLICLVVFPSITKNIFLSYVSLNTGYTNSVVYRLITEISLYILPIFPNFGEYINIMLITILPIIILFRLNNLFSYFEFRKIKSSNYNKRKLILYSLITIILLTVVMLTSGLFMYQALAIGSNSMSPKIETGDVVVLKRQDKIENIKKGEILVYKHDTKIIVHRVRKIFISNGNIKIITKGDNNNTNDSWTVDEKDIIGIVKFKIKYLGYPTVKLNELLNK